MKSVVAVIVTYNRVELLAKVLEAVANQSYPIKQILVVDNNSADNTQNLVAEKSQQYPNIAYHNTGDNLGGAGGFARGFELAIECGFDYLWLMDDDMRPSTDCLQNLLAKEFDGIRQPVRFNLDGSCAELAPVDFELANPFRFKPTTVKVFDLYPFTEDEIDIAGAPFEGPLISKSVVDTIGIPDSRYFIFYDDMEYSIRARAKGYSVKCVGAAKAERLLNNNQSNDLNSWKGYFMLRNFFYIHRTYGENFLVRQKPFLYYSVLSLKSVLTLNFKLLKTATKAIMDSKHLTNSEKNRP